ncbi:MAG TPA: sodium-dependent bicarbonate transport family permease [Burkholderiaceae bacterium]|nr:sodium-dependent bicarbonate transport family permease [Burkholderiaceae bacterium]
MTVDPVILFFLLGVGARLARSDLRIPEALYEALSIYLLLAIGFKGGVQLAQQPLGPLLPLALAAIAISAVTPLALFPLLRRLVRLPRPDAASIAAHYGSVSVVTFAVALSWLQRHGVPAEPQMAVLVALMEAPGIVVGVMLARPRSGAPSLGSGSPAVRGWGQLMHEVVFGKAVFLLLGGLVIGWIAGPDGGAPLQPLFGDLFKGVLALFLLEMGLVAGGRIPELRRAGPRLVAFGVLAPLALGSVAALIGTALGLSVGGVTLLATLASSASYIAAPTAMRIAVPEANPALSIGTALGVTFPFNVVFGIPWYAQLAQWLVG